MRVNRCHRAIIIAGLVGVLSSGCSYLVADPPSYDGDEEPDCRRRSVQIVTAGSYMRFTEIFLGNPEPVVLGGLYGWREKPTFTANEGQLVRVALAWENCPVPVAIDLPEMPLYVNFDLSVSTPIGTAKTNPSMVDNQEVLAFLAPATGTYTINVTVSGGGWRECGIYGGRETYMAVAWDVKEPDE